MAGPSYQSPSEFARYRPTYHVLAPRMWMNDPCGAVYIPETEEYLVLYQWYTGGTQWGSSAWGLARSKDLIRWTDGAPAIELGKEPGAYDRKGVFSGSVISRLDEQGRRVLLLFYTSVSHLPIHWSIPYNAGCETQSVALSYDFGKTWEKRPSNPLPLRAPLGNKTTGWRDPFVSPWPALTRLLASTPARSRSNSNANSSPSSPPSSPPSVSSELYSHLPTAAPQITYMLLSTGSRGVGPQLRIYASDSDDAGLEGGWRDLGVLFERSVQEKWQGLAGEGWDFGVNFECGSFSTIGGREFIVVGVEGGEPNRGHWVIWLEGQLVLDEAGYPKFEAVNCGRLDYGIFYSAYTFRGPASKTSGPEGDLLLWGWADEDDQSRDRAEQGWAGSLTVPRELFLLTAPRPADNDSHALPPGWSASSPSPDDEAGEEALEQMHTLGIRPAPQVAGLRDGAKVYELADFESVRSNCFEIEAMFTLAPGVSELGFRVRMSEDGREYTTIRLSLPASAVTIDRTHSSLHTWPNPAPVSGPFQLLPRAVPSLDLPWEDLHIRIFADNSLLEVFVNSRFALTTRIYPSLESAERVEHFSEGGVVEKDVRVYTGLVRAWESRGEEAWEGR